MTLVVRTRAHAHGLREIMITTRQTQWRARLVLHDSENTKVRKVPVFLDQERVVKQNSRSVARPADAINQRQGKPVLRSWEASTPSWHKDRWLKRRPQRVLFEKQTPVLHGLSPLCKR